MTLRSFSTEKYRFSQTRKTPAAEQQGPPARSPRRLVTGVALTAQKSRLIFTLPEGVVLAFQCRVIDVANGGYGIRLLGTEVLPPDCQTGTLAVLEQADKSLTPVELRWIAREKIGLKRLPRNYGV